MFKRRKGRPAAQKDPGKRPPEADASYSVFGFLFGILNLPAGKSSDDPGDDRPPAP